MPGELLFEIGTEELPAGYILPALEQLQAHLKQRLGDLALSFAGIMTAATPRRLAVSVQELAARQPDRKEHILGPPRKAAFDALGRPTKAAEGFARSQGIPVQDLQVVETPKGEYMMAELERPGRPTVELLAELLPETVTALSFPKSMRWGSGRLAFARPIQWLTAVYKGQTVAFSLDGLSSGNTTRGHRFMAPAPLEVQGLDQYLASLRRAQVLADHRERRQAVLETVARAARDHGGKVLPDEELIDTVTNLVEIPHPLCGGFEERFLELPRDVLITSMREHQKYFAVVDDRGRLLPHFVAVNNTRVKDPLVGVEGHQRVLRARLEDALFFFREDQARPLTERVAELAGVIFQTGLGTMLEKTERITILAGQMAKALAPELLGVTQRAAHLAKADLLTAMVNEFPSLQGKVGRDYALLNGEPAEVATAIYEHYLPVRAGDRLPEQIPGALVGMADRLDTIAGCFGSGQVPTGTADPFGLRRQALGLLHIILGKGFRISLGQWLDEALRLYDDKLSQPAAQTREQVVDFLKRRLTNDLTGKGVPAEAVEAVTSVTFDDVLDVSRRVKALVAISSRPAFPILAGSFKRVMNIIKDHPPGGEVQPALLIEEAERALHQAWLAVQDEATPLLAAGKYEQALEVMLRMKEPIDRFFDQVMVMVEDEPLRRNRLDLLASIASLFLRVGDFSKMYALSQGNHPSGDE